MANATHILKIVIQVVDNATAGLASVNKNTEKVSRNVDRINKRMQTFDMRLLSVMFGGMALARAFNRINKSIITTFLRAEDKTSGLARATTRLSAGWEFLKFSIMDALNADWFINFIDGLIQVINWFSQLDKEFKIAFLSITGGLAIIGTGLMVIAQFKLFWDAVFGMGGFARTMGIIHADTLGGSGVFTLIKRFAQAGVVIKALFDLDDFLSGKNGMAAFVDDLSTNLILAGLVFKPARGWTLTIGIALKLIPIAEQIEDFGENIANRGADRIADVFSEENLTRTPLRRTVGSLTGFAGGFLEVVGGGAISGAGIILGAISDYIDDVDGANTSTLTFKDSLLKGEKAVQNVLSSIDGEEQSLTKSLEKTGDEMDLVSGEKTTTWISSAKTLIGQNNETIESNNAVAESYRNISRAQAEDVADFIDASPVSED